MDYRCLVLVCLFCAATMKHVRVWEWLQAPVCGHTHTWKEELQKGKMGAHLQLMDNKLISCA